MTDEDREKLGALIERVDGLEERQQKLEKCRAEDHDMLRELHNILVKNGFVAKVRANSDTLRCLVSRHDGEDAVAEALTAKARELKWKIATALAFGGLIATSLQLILKGSGS